MDRVPGAIEMFTAVEVPMGFWTLVCQTAIAQAAAKTQKRNVSRIANDILVLTSSSSVAGSSESAIVATDIVSKWGSADRGELQLAVVEKENSTQALIDELPKTRRHRDY